MSILARMRSPIFSIAKQLGVILACVSLMMCAIVAIGGTENSSPADAQESVSGNELTAADVSLGNVGIEGENAPNTPVERDLPEVPPQPEGSRDVPAKEREVIPCYDKTISIVCSVEDVQAAIDKAGTTPSIIELGATELEVDKTIRIPEGADIMLVPQARPLNWDGDAWIKRSRNFDQVMISVEKGGRLIVDENPQSPGDKVRVESGWKQNYRDVSSPTVRVKGELVLNAAEITGARGVSGNHTGAITVTGEDALLTLNEGSLVSDNQRRRGTSTQNGAGNIAVSDGATLVMNGGTVSKGRGSGTGDANYGEVGGIGAYNGGRVYINGGTIKGNSGWAGGVLGMSWPWTLPAAQKYQYSQRNFIQINNGRIGENSAGFSGGGVFSFGNTVVEMNQGLISANSAPNGGGVGTWDDYVNGAERSYREIPGTGQKSNLSPSEWNDLVPGAFVMKGGRISGNQASRTGGGVNVISNEVHFLGGQIDSNSATQLGGGVYVATKSYTTEFQNALVRESNAKYIGGGVWVCPTGTIEMHVDNGAAIISNSAQSYGADLAHDNLGTIGAIDLWLSNQILGGTDAVYFRDGGSSSTGWQRYEPSNLDAQIEEIFKGRKLENQGLKLGADDQAMDRAAEAANLIIANNTAERGAGIGSNGRVVFGKNDDEVTDLEVLKKWVNADDSAYAGDTPESISLQLMRGEHKVGEPVQVKPDKNGNWRHKFTRLPMLRDGDLPYRVKEIGVPGFQYLTTDAVRNGDGFQQTIVNSIPVDLAIEKTWEGGDEEERPEEITVDLQQTIEGETTTLESIPLSAENDWQATVEDLPRFSDGKEITYSVKEREVPGYKPTYAAIERTPTKYIARLTNTRNVTGLTVEKKWFDRSGVELSGDQTTELPEVVVYLEQTVGNKTVDFGEPVVLNAENDWTASIDNLPVFVNEEKATYSVREAEVTGYSSKITGEFPEFVVENRPDVPPMTSTTPPLPPTTTKSVPPTSTTPTEPSSTTSTVESKTTEPSSAPSTVGSKITEPSSAPSTSPVTSEPNGATTSQTTPETPAPQSSTSPESPAGPSNQGGNSLAVTGASILKLLMVGLLCVVGGITVLVVRRRKD